MRNPSSTSDEPSHSAVNLSQAGSTERSLLSQQMHLNSLGNGGAHMGPSSMQDPEHRGDASRQYFPAGHKDTAARSRQDPHSTWQDPRGVGHVSNGGTQGAPDALSPGSSSTEQASAVNQSQVRKVPSAEWNFQKSETRRNPQHGQLQVEHLPHAATACCHYNEHHQSRMQTPFGPLPPPPTQPPTSLHTKEVASKVFPRSGDCMRHIPPGRHLTGSMHTQRFVRIVISIDVSSSPRKCCYKHMTAWHVTCRLRLLQKWQSGKKCRVLW